MLDATHLRLLFTAPLRGLASVFDPPVAVLAYHRVSDAAPDSQLLCVSPSRFEQQLSVLQREAAVLAPEAHESWSGSASHGRIGSVVITFDDGYADNAEIAGPVLERFGIPAVFFVATGFVESGEEMWWDRLERCLLAPSGRTTPLELQTPDGVRAIERSSPEQRLHAMRVLHPLLKYRRPEGREAILRQLHEWSEQPVDTRADYRPMTRPELRTLSSRRGIVIGSHGHSHTPFSILTPAEQRDELVRSKQLIETTTSKTVDVMSFPYGLLKDYAPETRRLCREAGYRVGFANYPDHTHRWTDRFAVPRFLVRNWDGETFRARLQSFFSALPRP